MVLLVCVAEGGVCKDKENILLTDCFDRNNHWMGIATAAVCRRIAERAWATSKIVASRLLGDIL